MLTAQASATEPALSLLYRGSLSSCNYNCGYCPFAKKKDSRAKLARDARELSRFVAWCAQQTRPLKILFTPWGEALVRKHYRQAMLDLLQMPHVQQVALQTNLSGPLSWLSKLDGALRAKLAVWATWHPDQIAMSRFLQRCAFLHSLAVPYSVGMVAMREHFAAVSAMRTALPTAAYLWLNAYDRRGPGYYSAADLAWLEGIDPWFHYNHKPGMARGKPCRAGESVLAVDGDGSVRRCHFLPQVLGNLYTTPLAQMLMPRPCSRFKCDCYLGYVHRYDLPFYQDFGHGVLARIAPVS